MGFVVIPFFIPKIRIFFRGNVTTIMTMPKATINEYYYSFLRKNKIRFPFQRISSTPTDNV